MQTLTRLTAAPLPVIPLSTAVNTTTQYRNKREVLLKEEYRDKDILPLSKPFRAEAIDAVLAVTACAGIPLYYGMEEQEKIPHIMPAVRDANADTLTASKTAPENEGITGKPRSANRHSNAHRYV